MIEKKCEQAGSDGYLLKPIDISTLQTIVTKYLTECQKNSLSEDTRNIPQRQTSDTAIISTLMGRKEKYDRMVEKFVHQLPTFISEVSNAYRDNDFSKLKQEAHRLKGVGGNYGFKVLTDTCISIEKDLETQALDKIREHLALLEKINVDIQHGLKVYFTSKPS